MKKLLIIVILLSFVINTLGVIPVEAQEIVLPKPGVMVPLSLPSNPPMLKGIKVHPDNPFRFDFILDRGDAITHRHPEERSDEALPAGRQGSQKERQTLDPSPVPETVQGQDDRDLKTESTRLIKYFLAALTVPEKDLWVNLSPYEKDRIVPESFGTTEMGRDLLAQDYMLKQITASLIYPEGEVGKRFWKRIYQEAADKYGTTNIPVNTFNKVWIVPQKAVVYENAKAGTAYVVESRLKVMLEQDYEALNKNIKSAESRAAGDQQEQRGITTNKQTPQSVNSDEKKPIQSVRRGLIHQALNTTSVVQGLMNQTPTDTNHLGSQIVREVVLPALEKEVNEGSNFAQLRQVYNSLILATWYKKKIKDSILSAVYANKNKVAGVGYGRNDTQAIYNQYLQAFKKGVYNYIKEEPDPTTGQAIPRKYFSGGFSVRNWAMSTVHTLGQLPSDTWEVKVDVIPATVRPLETINFAMASTAVNKAFMQMVTNKYPGSGLSQRF